MPDKTAPKKDTMRTLFFGDIVGKAGRRGIKHQLPLWREKFKPDIIIANVENIAHGFGIGQGALQEMLDLGVNVMTGGNHILQGKNSLKLLDDETLPLIRPLNVSSHWPGQGFITKKINDETNITVINLIGQYGMKDNYDSPFEAIETLLKKEEVKQNIIIIDWHAEASSEKVLLGWLLDGRVSSIFGTHTHTPTADERILPQGTGFISDAGMVGAHNSVIGVQTQKAIQKIAYKLPTKLEVEEEGPVEINAVLTDIDIRSKKTVEIRRLREIIPQ